MLENVAVHTHTSKMDADLKYIPATVEHIVRNETLYYIPKCIGGSVSVRNDNEGRRFALNVVRHCTYGGTYGVTYKVDETYENEDFYRLVPEESVCPRDDDWWWPALSSRISLPVADS